MMKNVYVSGICTPSVIVTDKRSSQIKQKTMHAPALLLIRHQAWAEQLMLLFIAGTDIRYVRGRRSQRCSLGLFLSPTTTLK